MLTKMTNFSLERKHWLFLTKKKHWLKELTGWRRGEKRSRRSCITKRWCPWRQNLSSDLELTHLHNNKKVHKLAINYLLTFLVLLVSITLVLTYVLAKKKENSKRTYPTRTTTRRTLPANMRDMFYICWIPNFYFITLFLPGWK